MAFGKYNRMPNSLLRDPGDVDIRPQHAKRSADESNESDSDKFVESSPVNGSTSSTPRLLAQQNGPGYQFPFGSKPGFKQDYSMLPDAPSDSSAAKQRAVPAPSMRYDPESMSLRDRRFLGLPHGGTVVVHYLKRNEWFFETALALLGRERMWDAGIDAPAYPAHVPPLPPGSTTDQVKQSPHDGVSPDRVSPIPTWNGNGEVELVSSRWGGARMYGSPLIRENGFIQLGRVIPWDTLEKSAEGKYGKYSTTPKMRYADPPQVEEPSHPETDSQISNAADLTSTPAQDTPHTRATSPSTGPS